MRQGPGVRPAYIDADFAASLSMPEVLLTGTFGDKANIVYVGFTRAIRELHLPPACHSFV